MHTIAIGSDPNADEAKKSLVRYLRDKGYQVKDFGSEDTVYANVAISVAQAVAAGEYERGVLLCGTGIGMSLAANKVPGAYAALLTDVYSAERARLSNDANIACFGAFTIGDKLMERLTETFLNNDYVPDGPSQPKVDRIRDFERGE